MNRMTFVSIVAVLFFMMDWYVFQAIRSVIDELSGSWRKVIYVLYWAITLISISGMLYYNLGGKTEMGREMRTIIFSFIFVNYFSKIFGVVFLLIDDVGRAVRWVWTQFTPSTAEAATTHNDGISRSDFLVKSSLIVTAVPALTMSYGIISGAHNYRIRRNTVYLKNLPSSFDGIRLAQISDIHSGSFFNKTAVEGGIDMLLAEKPDLVFFTGDLVNDTANEVKEYQNIFSKVKAPLGVYSTLGNHDYGDYTNWQSAEAKRKNLQNLIQVHQQMGWDLLMNENRFIQQGSDKIAILGIENWGTGGFTQYGHLDQAYKGTEDAPVKLLLSHDPSHWDAQVRQSYTDIDIMFAGHTHGMQFGIEIGDFKWSPVQYRYKQWAGLYQEKEQYLYVNRGYGYLVFPGRIGILPEITIMELKKA
ncbi:putative MPP superfamily phosphohydrolase [Catalinimonas alkaloidigena]|uniref:metallophosphoesterase n=1 Tax=Catalinimonas alkaloidigena TaxID=1075417 RepID=UPI0024076B88|nr:metallophosphoesterase [Catalinimonas alkaloidigena]MDF9797599.1 putative MPP superfamily phosphohydrolase [Catalinimonas alkaloidigena]